ncbi:hypothetical protein SBD_3272 [Streptomyces bottropensis ATCC 25435]|uniref:Uncharacterized protein n=1 Tax=Streptomyces bottropensis ATCC 25435 TaxID=1054862 RepID=M3F337_9ACTN|nr:hypothetical protein SBD_3272 [Streptomyces bottropensis ATCC 25435]
MTSQQSYEHARSLGVDGVRDAPPPIVEHSPRVTSTELTRR